MVARARAKAIAVLAGVFLLGALAGASGAYAFGQRRLAALVSEDREELHERRRTRALQRTLDLTDDQASRIQEIFRKHRAELRASTDRMFETCGAPVEQARKQLDDEILAVLTPEQQERFRSLADRFRSRFPYGKRGFRGPGDRRGPPDAPAPPGDRRGPPDPAPRESP
jgi:Spy/CpxP family protein refolding chaperone